MACGGSAVRQGGVVGNHALGGGGGGLAAQAGPGPGGGAQAQLGFAAQGKDLGQHAGGGTGGAQGAGQLRIARTGIGKDDVKQFEADTGTVQGLAEVGHGGARPGPGADGLQAGIVNVDEDDALLWGGAGAAAPEQVAPVFLQFVQQLGGSGVQPGPQQCGQGKQHQAGLPGVV